MKLMKFSTKAFISVSAAAGIASFLAACGTQQFDVAQINSTQKGPGEYTVPPKIDILLAEDDTGSIAEIYDAIKAEVPNFLNTLGTQDWDYHFAVTPLTTEQAMSQIVGSKYDSNWGSEWVKPFPGALANSPDTILSNLFRRPVNFSGFISSNQIQYSQNGKEPGLETIYNTLKVRANGTNFLRQDAMLAVIVMGNGDDTSGINYCPRPGDGVMLPCSDNSAQSSLMAYQSKISGLKANSQTQVKFFSAVSPANQSNCRGGSAYVGTRYQAMASYFGGTSLDICSQSPSVVMSSIAESLKQARYNYRSRLALLPYEPNLDTLYKAGNVVKYLGGDRSKAVVINQSATNGFTYGGYVTNMTAIEAPYAMNPVTGYVIELHGSAKLNGFDEIGFLNLQPAGATATK